MSSEFQNQEISRPLIHLTSSEMEVGAMMGLNRQLRCLNVSKNGESKLSEYISKWGDPGKNTLWGNHIEGALGEVAVAKFLNKYISGATAFGEVDVGEYYEVRTVSSDFHKLFLKKTDKKDKYYILVRGKLGVYRIWGYITAYEVFADPSLFHNNGGRTTYSYWVPDDRLHSIIDIPDEEPCQIIFS